MLHSRIGGALGISVLSHAALAALLLIFIGATRSGSTLVDEPVSLVFAVARAATETAGGGGGGGSRSKEQPRGTVPVTRPTPSLAAAAQPADALPAPIATIVTAAPLDMPGTVTGLSVPVRGPGTGTGTGTLRGGGAGGGDGDGIEKGTLAGTGGGDYVDGSLATDPVVLFEKKPRYSSDATLRRIEGTVEIEAIVTADGWVIKPRIITPLHPDLDRNALAAVLEWKFKPGRHRKTHEPVAVLVRIILSFSLR